MPYTKLFHEFCCANVEQTMVGKMSFPYAFSGNKRHINTFVLRHFQWRISGELVQTLSLKHKMRNNSPVRAQLKKTEQRSKEAKKPAITTILQRARWGLQRAVRLACRCRWCHLGEVAAWGHQPWEVGHQQITGANRYFGKDRRVGLTTRAENEDNCPSSVYKIRIAPEVW